MSPVEGSRRPYQPAWPVNQMRPFLSNVAVLRFAPDASSGSGHALTALVFASTRTIALRPPSVIHALPSGPTITPCGAERAPSFTSSTLPLAMSRMPSVPLRCPV
jgi:hypothetical protein